MSLPTPTPRRSSKNISLYVHFFSCIQKNEPLFFAREFGRRVFFDDKLTDLFSPSRSPVRREDKPNPERLQTRRRRGVEYPATRARRSVVPVIRVALQTRNIV